MTIAADRQSEVTAGLLRAADRLSQPGAWTRGVAARDAKGKDCPPRSERASCWCALGALTVEFPPETGLFPLASGRLHRIVPGLPAFGGLTTWNDQPEQTQTEVVAAFRRAAEA